MLYWIVQITVVSVVFILVVHNIFHFLKNTLTVPKAKDLVDVHMEKYKHIYATLNENDTNFDYLQQTIDNSHSGTTNIDDIPIMTQDSENKGFGQLLTPNENKNMKDELKNFMEKQLGGNSQKNDNSGVQFMQM